MTGFEGEENEMGKGLSTVTEGEVKEVASL